MPPKIGEDRRGFFVFMLNHNRAITIGDAELHQGLPSDLGGIMNRMRRWGDSFIKKIADTSESQDWKDAANLELKRRVLVKAQDIKDGKVKPKRPRRKRDRKRDRT